MRTPKRCLKYDSTRNFHNQFDNIIMPVSLLIRKIAKAPSVSSSLSRNKQSILWQKAFWEGFRYYVMALSEWKRNHLYCAILDIWLASLAVARKDIQKGDCVQK